MCKKKKELMRKRTEKWDKHKCTVFTHDQGSIWILILGAESSANYRLLVFYDMKDKILLKWCFLDVVNLK